MGEKKVKISNRQKPHDINEKSWSEFFQSLKTSILS